MNLLLDTNVLVWWAQDKRLDPSARAAIMDAGAQVYVSPVSIWEVSIKVAKGKLPRDLDLTGEVERKGFNPLPINLSHGERAGRLPLHHEDPFDRMLIAQAQIERLTIVTRDAVFDLYEVDVLPC